MTWFEKQMRSLTQDLGDIAGQDITMRRTLDLGAGIDHRPEFNVARSLVKYGWMGSVVRWINAVSAKPSKDMEPEPCCRTPQLARSGPAISAAFNHQSPYSKLPDDNSNSQGLRF